MSRGLGEILLIFEWLVHRSPVKIEDACRRFDLTPAELEGIVDTLASVGLNPGTPDVLLEAYVDEDDGCVHVRPFDGLRRGVSFDVEVARRLYAAALAVAGLPAPAQGTGLRGAIDKLRDALHAAGADVDAMRADLSLPGAELVGPLQEAILGRVRTEMDYRSPGSASSTTRRVDPIAVFRDGPHWYLDAFDHLRGERRLFRLDRIGGLHATEERFERIYEPKTEVKVTADGAKVRVELDCASEAAWLAEHVEAPEVRQAQGRVHIGFDAVGTDWLLPLLLAAGPGVRVVEPESLRTAFRNAVEAALARYAAPKRPKRR